MGSKTIIGLGLLALMALCALCVMRQYPFTGAHLAPTATLDAKLTDGKVVLAGTLPSQADKDRVLAQAATVYGAGNFIDRLTVGDSIGGDSWMSAALGLLPLANLVGAGGGVSLAGDAATISGQVASEEVRKDLVAKATATTAGMSLTDKLTVGGGALLPPFTATLAGGKVTLDGTVPDQSSLDRILAAASAAFGAGNFINNLKIAAPGSNFSWGADWLQKILSWIPFLGRFGSKGDISFNGRSVTVNGEVATADIKTRLLDDIRAIFGTNYTIVDNITVVESLLSETEAKAQADLKQLLLNGIEFDTASDKVTPGGAVVLDEAAKALKENQEANIEISGHTDNVGAAKMNEGLSQRRAASVKRYLTAKGIAADRMTPKGYGQTQPIADNATEEGRARNRRIEFRVIPKTVK
ncbi:MAG: OmpA family protein [Blastocatellia bacterium]